jgi:hypothetical protein
MANLWQNTKKKELQTITTICNTLILLVGREGFEPSANGLKVRCSTAELTAHLGNHFWTCRLSS